MFLPVRRFFLRGRDIARPMMGLLRILTNGLCRSVHAPQLPHVAAGHGARRSLCHVPAPRVPPGARPTVPSQFSSLTEFGTIRSGPRLTRGTTPRHDISLRATRDSHASRRSSNLTRCKALVIAICIYNCRHRCRYTEVIADVGKNLSALARRSVSRALMSDLLMRASSLAIMGVRVRVRHQTS